jgi:hypothetical protein
MRHLTKKAKEKFFAFFFGHCYGAANGSGAFTPTHREGGGRGVVVVLLSNKKPPLLEGVICV